MYLFNWDIEIPWKVYNNVNRSALFVLANWRVKVLQGKDA